MCGAAGAPIPEDLLRQLQPLLAGLHSLTNLTDTAVLCHLLSVFD